MELHSQNAQGQEAAADWPSIGLRRGRDFGPWRRRRLVATEHGPRDSRLRRSLALADVAGIVVALVVALLVTAHQIREFMWALPTLPAWIVVFKTYGLYDREIKRMRHTSIDDLPWIFHAVLLGCILLFGYYKLAPPPNIDMARLFVFGLTAMVTVTVMRSVARRLSLWFLGRERVVLVGDGDDIATLAEKLSAHPEYGIETVGLLSADGPPARVSGVRQLGDVADFDLAHGVVTGDVERIVVSHNELSDETMFELLRSCRELGVKLSAMPRLFDALGPSVEVDDVEGLTVLGVNPPVLSRSSRFLKRSMDVSGAVSILLLAAPLLAVIALTIKLSSRGPVLFDQFRVGRDGRRFRLFKFRTMVADAEERHGELMGRSKDPNWLLLDHDPRITRVGRLLRASSLDELPQLWNVLKGEMSLVGPRPLPESDHAHLEGWRESRIDLTPGLTGIWQVLGRTSIPFDEMIKLDYLYVTNWSLWTDVRLILRTVPAVLLRRGVN